MDERPFRRWTILLCAGTVLLGIARYVPIWNQPWGVDPASGNGAWYSGQPVRNWERLGFGTLRGMSLLGALPTHPPVGVPYAHHPPLFNWMIYSVVKALGFSERSFRALPILLSALSGLLIVLLALPRMGVSFAAVAALLWLMLPMSFVYGVMCNPEVATVFFILLTVWLHDRFRTSPPALYTMVLIAHFLAGQMDWEGHFTVPALLVYEILRPREDRRMRRVLVLGCVSLASAAVVFVLHGYFQDLAARSPAILASGGGDLPKFSFASIPKYAADGIQVAFRSADASVAGVESQGASTWFARQGRYLTEMFTWPAALAILAGIVMAFTRLTNGLALGMTLLVPGLLNVLVFRHHASEHEYWTYYLAPGVAVTTAEVVRILLKPRILAVAFLATVAAFSVHRIHQKLGEGREFDFKHLALELDQFLEHENEILICDVRFAPVTFYTRHWVVADMFSGRSWEHVENFRGLKKTGGLPNPVSFLVVPLGADPPLEELSGYGTLRRLDPPEVSARLPSIARQYDGPLWVLRID